MKSDQASASIMFSSTLATFIGFASAYVFSVPVSNNFELNRVYLYMLLVPGIVAALITGFLSKIVGTRIMALVTITVTSILLIACTIAASYFETTNTANYMVSIGHFLTHFPVLFMAFFAALLSSLTASFSHLLGNLSSHAGDSAYLMRAGLVNLLVALVIATCVAGIFMLYGFTWFLFLITLVEAVGLSIASIISVVSDNEKDVQPETPHVNHQEIQENTTSQPEALPERPGMNLATRVLLFFAMLCSGIMAGWMFPIASVVHDTTEFPPTSTYFVIKRTLVLEASLYTMVFGIGFILLILTIFKIKDITSASRRPASRASSITASQLGIFLSIA
nr:hypothetical protein [Candidatus Sigynarchaeota archaeon]